jgi:hypothetical protein
MCIACGGGGEKLDAPGVEGEIVLISPPGDGAGLTPTFRWEPVQGASTYRLAIQDPQGTGVWAWQGEETSIVMGGDPGRPENEAGPVVTEGSRWSVVALDADGKVVAVSELREVSP